MRCTLFGLATEMKVVPSGASFEFKSMDDKMIKKLSDTFGLDYIKVKHYLKDKEKEVVNESISQRIVSNDFKKIFEDYALGTAKTVTYSNYNITIKTDKKIFILSNEKNKRKLIMYVSWTK